MGRSGFGDRAPLILRIPGSSIWLASATRRRWPSDTAQVMNKRLTARFSEGLFQRNTYVETRWLEWSAVFIGSVCRSGGETEAGVVAPFLKELPIDAGGVGWRRDGCARVLIGDRCDIGERRMVRRNRRDRQPLGPRAGDP